MVVDSSIWIAHIRDNRTDTVLLFRTLLRSQALLVGDLTLLEILQGASNEAHSKSLEFELRRYQIVTMMDDRIAVLAARHSRTLRSFGNTPRKTVDLIIGTFCIAHGHELLHDECDFEPMHEHLGLRRA